MRSIIFATLLGLFLSTPALASSTDQALQIRSNSSKAVSGYVYVNRLNTPGGSPVSANTTAAERLSSQL